MFFCLWGFSGCFYLEFGREDWEAELHNRNKKKIMDCVSVSVCWNSS